MSGLPLRVMVQDVWDQVRLELPPGASVAETKQKALALTHASGQPDDYVVKYRGARVLDETRSLSEAGLVPNATLIVLRSRRRPVR